MEAKADYVLVLPCAYFGPQTSKQVIMRFYEEIAEKSPLPIVIVSSQSILIVLIWLMRW